MLLQEKKSLGSMAFQNSLPFLLLKFTLVSNNSGARGYLPETIFVGVSYLLLDFCFFLVVDRCPDVLLRYLTGSYLMSK